MRRKRYTWGMKKKNQVSLFHKKMRTLRHTHTHGALYTRSNKSMQLQHWPIRQWTWRREQRREKSNHFISKLSGEEAEDTVSPPKATCLGYRESLRSTACLKSCGDANTSSSWGPRLFSRGGNFATGCKTAHSSQQPLQAPHLNPSC